ncbi:MAG: type II toxin-antitoxin system Phd/YefM family antitoxin [Dehalococcoidia bacterium]|nr:type II toxin-antitoxin system Phd/YefM family antitoxin [Dehalococcoidia bacterium]
MQTIPARELKRRGISAVDAALELGPVHVIRNDDPAYVILKEAQYQELLESQEEAHRSRLREALTDAQAGRVTRSTAQAIITEFGLEG